MSFKCALLVRKRGPILYIAILLGAHCYGKHIRIVLFIYNAYKVLEVIFFLFYEHTIIKVERNKTVVHFPVE
jgi:hypothetical protein